MNSQEIQKKLDELGIVSIEAAGNLSSGLVNDAIASTEKLLSALNLDELEEKINKAERDINVIA